MLAPTGTIAFLMDCDTTGIEPDIALVKYKLLAGGGMLKIVNRTVPEGLRRLGYTAAGNRSASSPTSRNTTPSKTSRKTAQTVRSGLKPEHLPVFDCAFKPYRGKRSIHYLAHLKMMAAAQPFISGAISKTVNMPNECTVEDIRDAYVAGLEDGPQVRGHLSRRLQALAAAQHQTHQRRRRQGRRRGRRRARSTHQGTRSRGRAACAQQAGKPLRRRLSDTRTAITHKFDIAGHEGYLTVGLFEDGQPGELFITMAKEGSTIGGLMDSIGTLTSMALQYGVPLEALVRKFAHQRFEPSRLHQEPGHPQRLLHHRLRLPLDGAAVHPRLSRGQLAQPQPARTRHARPARGSEKKGQPPRAGTAALARTPTSWTSRPRQRQRATATATAAGRERTVKTLSDSVAHFQQDAPTCPNCGHVAVRNGACYKCLNCGESLGCS